MWPRWSHVLDPLTEAASGPKGRSILWNNNPEVEFCETKHMVSEDTLLNYPDCTIPLDVPTYSLNKQLGYVISKNGKIIALFLRRLRNQHSNYTTT